MGEEMFVMYHIGRHKLMLGIDLDVIKMCNKMHESFKLMVEWGIGGFKCKWRMLIKHFDFAKDKYNHMFKVVALFINILHMCQ